MSLCSLRISHPRGELPRTTLFLRIRFFFSSSFVSRFSMTVLLLTHSSCCLLRCSPCFCLSQRKDGVWPFQVHAHAGHGGSGSPPALCSVSVFPLPSSLLLCSLFFFGPSPSISFCFFPVLPLALVHFPAEEGKREDSKRNQTIDRERRRDSVLSWRVRFVWHSSFSLCRLSYIPDRGAANKPLRAADSAMT